MKLINNLFKKQKISIERGNRIQHLFINRDILNEIKKHDKLDILLPFYEETIKLNLEKRNILSENFKVSKTTKDGLVNLDTKPRVQNYIIKSGKEYGTALLSNNNIKILLSNNKKSYILSPSENGDTYILRQQLNDESKEFSCGVIEHKKEKKKKKIKKNRGGIPQSYCLNVAVDIDYYTYNQFGGNIEDINNWVYENFATVHNSYYNAFNGINYPNNDNYSNINFFVLISNIHIWDFEDPMNQYNNPNNETNFSDMLESLINTWNSSQYGLNTIEKDIVHLCTMRNNTGTGGVAWLDIICPLNTNINAGYSSLLDFNLSLWNQMVIPHEIGHNIGANHTHWCGWPLSSGGNGPLDDCYTPEGGCTADNYNTCNNDTGTIMSYCHLCSSGGLNNIQLGIFHSTVIADALLPNITGCQACDYLPNNSITLNKGWNLVSFSMTEPIDIKDDIFSDIIIVYTFSNKYELVDKIVGGVGYWIRCNKEVGIEIPNFVLGNIKKTIKNNWSLVGTPSVTAIINIENIIPSSIYSYNNNKYNVLEPTVSNINNSIREYLIVNYNEAYWIRRSNSNNGNININILQSPVIESAEIIILFGEYYTFSLDSYTNNNNTNENSYIIETTTNISDIIIDNNNCTVLITDDFSMAQISLKVNDGILTSSTGNIIFKKYPAKNTITINIITDNYPGETTWELELDNISIRSGGPYSTTGNQGDVVIPNMPNGDYTFIINDSYGDGICCSYGIGSYTISVNGNNIASGGDFDTIDTVNFTI